MIKKLFDPDLSLLEKATLVANEGTLLFCLESPEEKFLLFNFNNNFIEIIIDNCINGLKEIEIVSTGHVEQLYVEQVNYNIKIE